MQLLLFVKIHILYAKNSIGMSLRFGMNRNVLRCTLMVFSQCLKPIPIMRPMNNSIELFGGVHTAQRQTATQIPIGLGANLSVTVSFSVSGSVNAPLHQFDVCRIMRVIQHGVSRKTPPSPRGNRPP